MFSFSNVGTPVARINGGKYNGYIVYLKDTNDNAPIKAIEETDFESTCPLTCKYCKKKFTRADTKKRHIDSSCRMKVIHEYVNNYLGKEIDKSFFKSLHIDDGKFEPLPKKKREVQYIAAPAGSGKSTYLASWLQKAEQDLDKDIILFSRIEEDIAFKNLKHLQRIPLDETLLTDPITMDELEDSIVIFDDIDTSQNPKITKYLENLRDDLIKNGRDHTGGTKDIYVIATNHQISNYVRTRDVLYEATSITVFPSAACAKGINYALSTYIGLTTKQIKYIKDLNTRWVTFYKTIPAYAVAERDIFILKNLEE